MGTQQVETIGVCDSAPPGRGPLPAVTVITLPPRMPSAPRSGIQILASALSMAGAPSWPPALFLTPQNNLRPSMCIRVWTLGLKHLRFFSSSMDASNLPQPQTPSTDTFLICVGSSSVPQKPRAEPMVCYGGDEE